LMQQVQMADNDLQDVMGLSESSLGNEDQAKSGRAIYARAQQGEIINFNYKDNMTKGHELMYELMIDLIPVIYDTERELRILGSDGAEQYKRVNQIVQGEDGNAVRVNDMAVGKYDVTVTAGPSFSTQRQEAAETYSLFAQNDPTMMQIGGDIVWKSMDLPYADEMSERFKAMLPPPIQQMLQQSEQDIPPEVQQAMAQADMAMQQVQQQAQLVQQAASELEGEKSLNEKQKAEIKTEIANLRADKAEFDAHMAEATAKLMEVRAGLTVQDANLTKKGADLSVKESSLKGIDDTAEILESIDKTLEGFIQDAYTRFQAMNDRVQAMSVDKKFVGGNITRKGGKVIADVQFSDGSSKRAVAVRDGNGLKLVGDDAEP